MHVSHNMTLGVRLCITVTTTTIVTEYVCPGGNDLDLGGMMFMVSVVNFQSTQQYTLRECDNVSSGGGF